MNNETYAALTAPMPTFKKPGSNLDYHTGEQVISRLNEVLGWDAWSFRVLEHGYNEEADELWCLGELTVAKMVPATATVHQQFGSQKHNRYSLTNRDGTPSTNPNAGKIIDLGFDLKGAATDALKKCASLIGVSLYLHEKDSPSSGPVARPAEGARQVPNGAAKEREDHVAVASQPPAAPPPKKPNFLELTDSMGLTREFVIDQSDKLFGNRQPLTLTVEQKRRLLVALEDVKNQEKKKEPAIA